MDIVQKYGRNVPYDFESDVTLAAVRYGDFSYKENSVQSKKLLCIDGFMTIWLLMLPEKFREWYELYSDLKRSGHSENTLLSKTDLPKFAKFGSDGSYTFLTKNPDTQSYDFLPQRWNLMECFERHVQQEDVWCTESIEFEYNYYQKKNSPQKKIAEKKSLPESSDQEDQESSQEEEGDSDDEEETEEEEELPVQVAIKQASDNEQDNREASRLLNERIPKKRKSPTKSTNKPGETSTQKKKKAPVKEDDPAPIVPSVVIANMGTVLEECMLDWEDLHKRFRSKHVDVLFSIRGNLLKLIEMQKQLADSAELNLVLV